MIQSDFVLKTHIIVDFYHADSDTLARATDLKLAIDNALDAIAVKIKQDNYMQFEPQGVTATVVGELFHFSIHTWPEYGSCAVDLYSLEEYDYARNIANALREALLAKEYDLKLMQRMQKIS
jgi:S-adenosylmethionine decarboxylase